MKVKKRGTRLLALLLSFMVVLPAFTMPGILPGATAAVVSGGLSFDVETDGNDVLVKLVNGTNEKVEGYFIVASYKSSGVMAAVYMEQFASAPLSRVSHRFEDVEMADHYKAFLWDLDYIPIREIDFEFSYDMFNLVVSGVAADVYVDADDFPGIAHAADNLTMDIEMVTGVPANLKDSPKGLSRFAVIAGSIGNSPVIDGLIADGVLDVSEVEGKWESYVIDFISMPVPGVEVGMVIAGSDKRGTIYGIYSISDILGVSPWLYFADSEPNRRSEVVIPCQTVIQGEPSVKYRGIFLNDERQNQVWLSYLYRNDLEEYALFPNRLFQGNRDASVAIGHKFYVHIFDAILRMKGNYMWPIMWNNAFFSDDPLNGILADEYGVVMGMSHHEFMSRPDKDWNWWTAEKYGNRIQYRTNNGLGNLTNQTGLQWAYIDNFDASDTAAKQGNINIGVNTRDVIHEFWREGIEMRKDLEQVVVLGLRGQNDTSAMGSGATMQDNVDLLRTVVANQRQILEDVHGDATKQQQCIVLYNEVDIYYYAGYKDYVPDDVIVVLANDMHGNTRSLPTAEDRNRPGGFGMYYHFDYNGSPRSTRFLSSIQPEKIREQMVQAYDYGVDKLWVVNVGNLKFYEAPTEYWMNLAYDIDKWGQLDGPDKFYKQFAEREFGSDVKEEAAQVVFDYIHLNNCRYPEIVLANTFSTTYFDEAQAFLAQSDDIRARAEAIYLSLPDYKKLTFYEIVLFPVRMSNSTHRLMIYLALNQKYNTAGMIAESVRYAALARAERVKYIDEMNTWKTIKPQPQNNGAGKWTGYFPVSLSQTSWGNTPVLSEYTSRGWGVGGSRTNDNNIYYLGLTTWNHQSTLWNFATTGTTWTRIYETAPAAGSEMIVATQPYMGSTTNFTTATRRAVDMPPFQDVYVGETNYIEVGNARAGAFTFNAAANDPWIVLSQTTGSVTDLVKVDVSIDWSKIPAGTTRASGTVTITSNAANGTLTPVTVNVTAIVADQDLLKILPDKTFIEDDYGYVSMLSKNYAKSVAAPDGAKWTEIPNYGRSLSAMKVIPNVFDQPRVPGVNSPYLEYNVYISTPGVIEIATQWTPSMAPDFHKKFTKFQYGITFGGDPVQTINTVSANYRAHNTASANWSSAVEANSRTLVTGGNNNCYSRHTVTAPGLYTLRIYLVDDNLVLQKIIIGTSKIPTSARNTFTATSNDAQTLYCYPDTREMFSLLNGSEYPRGSGTIVTQVSGYREPANPNAVPRLLIGPTNGAVAPVSAFFGPPETFYTITPPVTNGFELVANGVAADVYVDAADLPGITHAADNLTKDIKAVTGVTAQLKSTAAGLSKFAVIAGSIGNSPAIDTLIAQRRLDVSDIEGKWEAYTICYIRNPVPGVDIGLVIAGSDKRGTVYGIYKISETIGVTPWGFFADSVPTHQDELILPPDKIVQGEPSVKYRGIFINDERSLDRWMNQYAAKNNHTVPFYSSRGAYRFCHEFYTEVFDMILRNYGNYLWPAMWNNSFWVDDPLNGILADQYGIVIGTTHQEFMNCPDKEWVWTQPANSFQWVNPNQPDNWQYTNRDGMIAKWTQTMTATKGLEAVVNMGLRGLSDVAIFPRGTKAQNIRLLNEVIEAQRDIIKDVYGHTDIPQSCIIYKEVEAFYWGDNPADPNDGWKASIADDVTVILCEDNHGNVRALPLPQFRNREGGYGMYYHFDYNGAPRSYRWMEATPAEKIREQMMMAYDYGVDRIWVTNVGDLKFNEPAIDYWFKLAYDVEKWGGIDGPEKAHHDFAAKEFGEELADEIAEIMAGYIHMNGIRKGEIIFANTMSQNYFNEADRMLAQYKAIADRAIAVKKLIPPERMDTFYNLVFHPVLISYNAWNTMINLGKNQVYGNFGLMEANKHGEIAAAGLLFDTFSMTYTWGDPVIKDATYDATVNTIKQWLGEDMIAATTATKPDGNKDFYCVGNGKYYGFYVRRNLTTPYAINASNIWYLGLTTWNHRESNANGQYALTTTGTSHSRRFTVTAATNPVISVIPQAWAQATSVQRAQAGGSVALPAFTSYGNEKRYIDVGTNGNAAIDYTVTANQPWIIVGSSGGTLGAAPNAYMDRFDVSIDWSQLSATATGSITIQQSGQNAVTVNVTAEVFNTSSLPAKTFVETPEGYISMLSTSFAKSVAANKNGISYEWKQLPNYGREFSAMKVTPTDPDCGYNMARTPGVNSPYLEYNIYVKTPGQLDIVTQWAPTNGMDARQIHTVQYAVQLDNAAPVTVNTLGLNFFVNNAGGIRWADGAESATRTITGRNNGPVCFNQIANVPAGFHTIRIYMVNDGLVLQKVLVGTSKITQRTTVAQATGTNTMTSTSVTFPAYTLPTILFGTRDGTTANIAGVAGAASSATLSSFLGPPESYYKK